MASSANILTHSTLYSIISSKQDNIFSCRRIVPGDSQAAEPETHRRRRSLPTALIRFISKRWNLLKYLLEVHDSSYTWRENTHTHTHTHTHGCGHTGLIGSLWHPRVKSASEHPGFQLSHVQRLLTSCETNCTFESEGETMPEKNVLTHCINMCLDYPFYYIEVVVHLDLFLFLQPTTNLSFTVIKYVGFFTFFSELVLFHLTPLIPSPIHQPPHTHPSPPYLPPSTNSFLPINQIFFFFTIFFFIFFFLFAPPPPHHTHTHTHTHTHNFYHELIKLAQYRKVAKVLVSYIGPALPLCWAAFIKQLFTGNSSSPTGFIKKLK